MTPDAFVLMIYLTGTAYLDATPKPIAVFASEKQEGDMSKLQFYEVSWQYGQSAREFAVGLFSDMVRKFDSLPEAKGSFLKRLSGPYASTQEAVAAAQRDLN